jgi:thiosulfate/3-mercaptopyruvate sulfurtransferase
VLDGGLDAWPGDLETDLPDVAPLERTPRPWPATRFVDADAVAATAAAVYDARTAQRYAAGDPAIDPRPGHLPGAISAPWAGNLGEDGRFRPAAELRDIYRAAMARGAIAYCGSGVTSCHDLLAMELAGIAGLALYPGSWSQWGADPSRPIEESS